MILETQVRLIGGIVAFEECCILDICESFNEKCNVNPIVLGALYLEDLFMENGLGMGFLHEYGSVYSSGSLSECVVLIIFFWFLNMSSFPFLCLLKVPTYREENTSNVGGLSTLFF